MQRELAHVRRGFCPSVWTPMASGDGLLVRVRAGAGPLTAVQLRTIARLSAEHGNGQSELTRRANLQLRGVREGSLAALRAELIEAGLAEAEPAREKQLSWLFSDPLAGLEGNGELEPLVLALTDLLQWETFPANLPAKLSIVIDGGRVPADVRADLYVTPHPAEPERVLLGLPAPAHARLVASIERAQLRAAVRALLIAFASVLRAGGDIDGAERSLLWSTEHAVLSKAVGAPFVLRERAALPPARPSLGLHRGLAPWLAFTLPFGAGEATQWQAIAALCERHGVGTLRTTAARTLLMPLRAHGDVALCAAEDIGLLVDAGDPLLRVSACAGAPACASARGETRSLARALSSACAAWLHTGGTLHVSGCEKSCAQRGAAGATLVRTAGGVRFGTNADVAATMQIPSITLEAATQRLTALARAGTLPPALGHKHEYERDGAEIYRRSFAVIRSEARLERFSPLEERVAVRLIHTCGMVDLADDLVFTAGFVEAARRAIQGGAPILCDAKMIVSGVTRARLRADNELLCFLDHPSVPALARELATTRSAAALSLWKERLDGAVVAIGNAPTALFRLLELLDELDARPSAIIGLPVGFVGAAESKQALVDDGRVPALVVRGRRGGSALAVAAINALASDEE